MVTKNFCLLLLLLASIAAKSQPNNGDIRLLRKINFNSSIGADKTFRFISNSSTPIGLCSPVTLFIVGAIQKDELLKRNSYRHAASLALSSGLSYILKISFQRKRPFVTYPDIIKKSHGGSWSFPSGHTTFAFATATSLTLSFPKWYVAVPAYLWASTVAYSRMYLGVHYPSDVLGGIILGIGTSFLVWKLDEYFLKK